MGLTILIRFRSPFQPISLQERMLKNSCPNTELTIIKESLMRSYKRRLLSILDKSSSIPNSSEKQVCLKRQQNQFPFLKYPIIFPRSLQEWNCPKQATIGFFFLRLSLMTNGKKLRHQSKIECRVCVRCFPRRCAKTTTRLVRSGV